MTPVTLIIPDWVGFFIVVLCWLTAANLLTEMLLAWMRARAQKKAIAEFQRVMRESVDEIVRRQGAAQ